jgi:anti-sigma28 factor (negative regulator of flagellin synthesis)
MKATPDPETRAARIAAIRRQIESGTYESIEKLHSAIRGLLAEAAERAPKHDHTEAPRRPR